MAARHEVHKIQLTMIKACKKAFAQLMLEEEAQYGEVSFFRWWYGGGREGSIPQPRGDGVPSRDSSPDILNVKQPLKESFDLENETSEDGGDGFTDVSDESEAERCLSKDLQDM